MRADEWLIRIPYILDPSAGCCNLQVPIHLEQHPLNVSDHIFHLWLLCDLIDLDTNYAYRIMLGLLCLVIEKRSSLSTIEQLKPGVFEIEVPLLCIKGMGYECAFHLLVILASLIDYTIKYKA